MSSSKNIAGEMQRCKNRGLSFHEAKEYLASRGYTQAQITDVAYVYSGSSDIRLTGEPNQATVTALMHMAEADSARHMSDVADQLGPTQSGGIRQGIRFRHYGPSSMRSSYIGFAVFVAFVTLAYWLVVWFARL